METQTLKGKDIIVFTKGKYKNIQNRSESLKDLKWFMWLRRHGIHWLSK